MWKYLSKFLKISKTNQKIFKMSVDIFYSTSSTLAPYYSLDAHLRRYALRVMVQWPRAAPDMHQHGKFENWWCPNCHFHDHFIDFPVFFRLISEQFQISPKWSPTLPNTPRHLPNNPKPFLRSPMVISKMTYIYIYFYRKCHHNFCSSAALSMSKTIELRFGDVDPN